MSRAEQADHQFNAYYCVYVHGENRCTLGVHGEVLDRSTVEGCCWKTPDEHPRASKPDPVREAALALVKHSHGSLVALTQETVVCVFCPNKSDRFIDFTHADFCPWQRLSARLQDEEAGS